MRTTHTGESAGCEAQALSPIVLYGSGDCALQDQSPPDPPRGNVDPFEGLRGDEPGGLALQQQWIISRFVGNRVGVIITYVREAQDSQPTSP